MAFLSVLKLLLLWEDLADDSQTLRPSFSKKNGGSDLQVLRSIHESKLDESSVARAHEVFVHFKHLGTLTDDTAMNHCLVVWLDRRGVVQDLYLGFEVLDGHWVHVLVKEDHALSESCPFELVLLLHAFDCETDSLAGHCFLDGDHLVVDGLNHHRLEVAVFVRA